MVEERAGVLEGDTVRAAWEPSGTRPSLVYLVTEDWYFLSHRLPMACAAQRAGYDVHVATHVSKGTREIEALGFHLHPLEWRRGSMNPADLISIVRQVRALYRSLRPDLVHHVALQPAVIGSLAATGLSLVRVNALAGLGFSFTSRSLKAMLIRPVLTKLLRRLLDDPQGAVLVQNPDDRAAVQALGISPHKIFVVQGSGVDIGKFAPLPEPKGPVTVGFVGRLLDDKGVGTLIEAHDILRARGENIQLLIAGDRDPANPASIAVDTLDRWKEKPGVAFAGHVSDIHRIWAASHIAVLPSRREGLPKSLLEAAACGRPIVATDVPGCREIARSGINALLVPPDDPAALAEAILTLANDPGMRMRFGVAGRKLVEEEFSSERIGQATVALYDTLLGPKTRLLPAAAGGG
jgi:glycosyltransferase involved in cell wall biosynthesis